MSAWRELSARGVKHALILEDDASLLCTWDAYKLSANAWLDASSSSSADVPPWTFLMLGWLPMRAARVRVAGGTPHLDVVRVLFGYQSHAYIVNLQQWASWLPGIKPYNGVPIDTLNAQREILERRGYKGLHTFAVRPMGFVQRRGVGSSMVVAIVCCCERRHETRARSRAPTSG